MNAKFNLCLLLIPLGTVSVLGARLRDQREDTVDVDFKQRDTAGFLGLFKRGTNDNYDVTLITLLMQVLIVCT